MEADDHKAGQEEALHQACSEEWARSLVGRDWEIFWDEENDEDEVNREEKENENDDDNDNENEDDDDDDSEIEDWYEAYVNECIESGDGMEFSFKVTFVGDEHVYTMRLEPDIVRPSARAWVKRTRSILGYNYHKKKNKNGKKQQKLAWEDLLPKDTSTVDDKIKLDQIRLAEESKLPKELQCMLSSSAQESSTTKLLGVRGKMENHYDEFFSILCLRVLINSQIYLRSKLSTLDQHEPHFNSDPEVPSESYVNYLVECLQNLIHSCDWYESCWKFYYQRVVAACSSSSASLKAPALVNNNDNISTTSSILPMETFLIEPEKITEVHLFETYIATGRQALIQIVNVDTSCAGAKAAGKKRKRRSRTSTTSEQIGTRKTKRRRQRKSYFNSNGLVELDEDIFAPFENDTYEEFIGNRITDFLQRIQLAEDRNTRWYMTLMGSMLRRFTDQIMGPFLAWKSSVQVLLGDKIEEQNIAEARDQNSNGRQDNHIEVGIGDEKASDGETSEEDSDNDDEEDVTPESSGDNDDGDDSSAINDDGRRFFNYDDIQSNLQAIHNDQIVRLFDVSTFETRIVRKLEEISSFEKRAWQLISQVMIKNLSISEKDNESTNTKEKPDDKQHQSDAILDGLRELRLTADLSTSLVFNVDPIAQSSVSPITRHVLQDAITLRTWCNDFWHAENFRERLSFIEGLVSRASELPQLPVIEQYTATISEQLEASICRARSLLPSETKLKSLENNRKLIKNRRSKAKDCTRLCTKVGVVNALNELSEIPLISIAEEMLAVRNDTFSWKDHAEQVLKSNDNEENTRIQYDDLHEVKTLMDLLLDGKSVTRSEMLKSVKPSEEVDTVIRSFVSADAGMFCGSIITKVLSLFGEAFAWKEKADSIVSTLQLHGYHHPASSLKENCINNSNIQASIMMTKSPPMVDLKRVYGLLEEYDALNVALPYQHIFLQNIREQANQWSSNTAMSLLDESKNCAQIFDVLKETRENRPKGIIVDPARHIVDLLIDLISWHQGIKEAIKHRLEHIHMSEKLEASHVQKDDTSDPEDNDDDLPLLKWTTECVVPAVAEGIEVIELFSKKRPVPNQFIASYSELSSFLSSQHKMSRKACKIISITKIESSPLASAVLNRLIDSRFDQKEGSPLACLLTFVWRIYVVGFIMKHNKQKSANPKLDNPLLTTLEEAKFLLEQKPCVKVVNPDHDDDAIDIWDCHRTSDFEDFMYLIEDGESLEANAQQALSRLKELLRKSYQKKDEIRSHLTKLKELHGEFKIRMNGKRGLLLSRALERQLEHHTKVFSWLVKTLPYPCLHLDGLTDLDSNERIPWDVLLTLHEKKPSSLEGFEDCAGVVIRVGEIYTAAKAWQEVISNFTNLSFRGAKRRGEALTSPPKAQETESENNNNPKVDFGRLARDPILLKVAMPREAAVSDILESVKKFEMQLQDLLVKDYDGIHQDRAPYPESDSLVGQNREFLLFRLTGSPLFGFLKTSLNSIAVVADEVHVDTPGKAAFEWIQQATAWVESLHMGVIRESPFQVDALNRLIIPKKDAKNILEEGEKLFLDISDDVKKTLSRHLIVAWNNKVEGKLKVAFKKGGAHHSVGGTMIRWCPILFDSLKEDISKLEKWEASVEKTIADFKEKSEEMAENNDDALYLWYRFHEETSKLLQEGIESLVISPEKDTIESFESFHSKLCTHLQDQSNTVIEQRFAKRRYEDSDALFQDRFLILDSLMSRRIISAEDCDEIEISNNLLRMDFPKDSSFRDTCRSYLEKALRKGTQMSGFASDDETYSTQCMMKAWEIEHVLFHSFQGSLGEAQISTEYRNKARSLRGAFEDLTNPIFCARVLVEDIDASELISMTMEEIESSKFDLEAELEVFQKDSVKNGVEFSGSEKEAGNHDECKTPGEEPRFVNGQFQTVDNCVKPMPICPSSATVAEKSENVKSNQEIELKCPLQSKTRESSKAILQKPMEKSQITTSFKVVEGQMKPTPPSSSSPRPIAPPSLVPSLTNHGAAANFVTTRSASNKHSKNVKPIASFNTSVGSHKSRKYLSSASGQEVFALVVSKRRFRGRLYLERDAPGLHHIIPRNLSEKGRLPIEEFIRFLSDKLRGGKWTANALRLVASETDTNEYKKYYKEYESIKRIALFALSETSKLFLVTPKFHRAASKVLGELFVNQNSTYAVILTKDHV